MVCLKEAIEKLGFPSGDDYSLPSSPLTFADGANYRIEISGIERLANLEAMIDESEKRNVPVHRIISMVGGPGQVPFDEIKEMATICRDKKYELMVNVSNLRGWDTGVWMSTEEGIWSGLTCRGMDMVYNILKEMERLIEAGVKGFLIFDCGLLKLVKDLKENGYLPKDIVIKASVVAGAGSPVTAKLIQDVGASTVNPLGDITLPQLAAMRKVIDIPMDVYMTVVQAMGGMHRYHQAAELARIGSPVYFKFEPGDAEGNIYKEYCEIDYNNFLNRQKIIQAQCTIEWINRYNPEIKCSAPGPDDLTLCDPK